MSKSKMTSTSHAIDSMNDAAPPLDYSFRSVATFPDLLDEEPRPSLRSLLRQQSSQKYKTNALRLNNNSLPHFNGFETTIEALLESPGQLSWLDLSFNCLPSIDKVILQYPEIKVLNMHGNCIEKISEIDKLVALRNLRSLTLHGNPIEDIKGYRDYIISKIPQLEKLDFSKITKADRECSKTTTKLSGLKHKKAAIKAAES